jgi:hypothetical protein
MLTLTTCSDNFTWRSVAEPGPLEAEGAVIFGQASDPLVSTITDILKPEVKQDGGIYSQPNVELLNTTLQSPDSNVSSDTGNSSIMSMSASTLPTSEDEDSDADASVQTPRELAKTTLPKPVKSDGERGQLRSLKRGHSGDDARCSEQHPYLRPRKQCSQRMTEINVSLESAVFDKPLLSSLSDGGKDGTGLSLRRKGNFIKHNENGDHQRNGNVAIIR